MNKNSRFFYILPALIACGDLAVCAAGDTPVLQTEDKISADTYFARLREQILEANPKSMWSLEKRQADQNRVFATLDIRLGAQDILRHHAQYKVLINRMPSRTKLIIGCGNLPAYRDNLQVHFIDNFGGPGKVYRAEHTHADADTLDPDFARNPTVTGSFGYVDFAKIYHEVFKDHKYQQIIFEGIWEPALHCEPQKLIRYQQDFEALLDNGGIVIMDTGVNRETLYRQSAGWTEYGLERLNLRLKRSGSVMETEEARFEITGQTVIGDETYSRLAVSCIDDFTSKRNAFLARYRYTAAQFMDLIRESGIEDIYEEHRRHHGWENFEVHQLGHYFSWGEDLPLTVREDHAAFVRQERELQSRMEVTADEYQRMLARLKMNSAYAQSKEQHTWQAFESDLLKKMAGLALNRR